MSDAGNPARPDDPGHRDDLEPLGDEDLTEKDTSYSPASEREQAVRDAHPRDSEALDDPAVRGEGVDLLPGTGGPDDPGDVDVPPEQLNLP